MLPRYMPVGLLVMSFFTSNKYYSQPSPSKTLTRYQGGKSTALQAIVKIGIADRVPIGIIFGAKQVLCREEKDYVFTGLSTQQALEKVLDGTNYSLTNEEGTYDLWAPDLTQREQQATKFRFPGFSSSPTTMADLGARLTGYISMSIEGASGFLINTPGKAEDEIVTLNAMTEVTAPQVANAIVGLGSKGLWIMRAAHSDNEAKQGSTVVTIYSYHDATEALNMLTCPVSVVK